MSRLVGSGPANEERELRRAFRSLDTPSLEVRGELAIGAAIEEATLVALEDREFSAEGSARYRDLVRFRGNAAVDGNAETAWSVDNTVEARLHLTFPGRNVDTVRIRARYGAGLFAPRAVSVLVDGEVVGRVDIEPTPCGTQQCGLTLVVPLDVPRELEQLDLVFPALGASTGEQPIRIDEVDFGETNLPRTSAPTDRCVSDLVHLDGESIPVRIPEGIAALLEERQVAFEGCLDIALEAGWHELDTAPGILGGDLTLTPPGFREILPVDAPDVTIEAEQTSPTDWGIRLIGDDDVFVSLGQSWHPGWTARMGGTDLGEAIAVDGVAGWYVPAGSRRVLVVSFGPQTVFELGLLISVAGVIVVAGIARHTPAGTGPLVLADIRPTAPSTLMGLGARVAAALAMAYLIGGWSGLGIGAAALLVIDDTPARRAIPVLLGAAALAITTTTGLIGHDFDESTFGPDFAREPAVTATWGRYAGILLVVGLVTFNAGERHHAVGNPAAPIGSAWRPTRRAIGVAAFAGRGRRRDVADRRHALGRHVVAGGALLARSGSGRRLHARDQRTRTTCTHDARRGAVCGDDPDSGAGSRDGPRCGPPARPVDRVGGDSHRRVRPGGRCGNRCVERRLAPAARHERVSGDGCTRCARAHTIEALAWVGPRCCGARPRVRLDRRRCGRCPAATERAAPRSRSGADGAGDLAVAALESWSLSPIHRAPV